MSGSNIGAMFLFAADPDEKGCSLWATSGMALANEEHCFRLISFDFVGRAVALVLKGNNYECIPFDDGCIDFCVLHLKL